MKFVRRGPRHTYPEQLVAHIPAPESRDLTATDQIQPFVAGSIAKVRELLRPQLTTEGGQYMKTEAASATINGLRLGYHAIVSSRYNDPSATVEITAGDKSVALSFGEDYANAGAAESNIRVATVAKNGTKSLDAALSLKADGRVLLENPAAVSTSPEAHEVPYDVSFDGQISAMIAEAQQLVRQLPDSV